MLQHRVCIEICTGMSCLSSVLVALETKTFLAQERFREREFLNPSSLCADFQVNHRLESASTVAKSFPGLLLLHNPDGDVFIRGYLVKLVLVLTFTRTHRGDTLNRCSLASFINSAKFNQKKFESSEVFSSSIYKGARVFLDTFFLLSFIAGFWDRIVSWTSAFLCGMFDLFWQRTRVPSHRVRCHLLAIEAKRVHVNAHVVVDSRPAVIIHNHPSISGVNGPGDSLTLDCLVEMITSRLMMPIPFLYASAYRNCGVFLTSSLVSPQLSALYGLVARLFIAPSEL